MAETRSLGGREDCPVRQKVTPCLWFDGYAEQAVAYYVSLLPDSRIDRVVRSPVDTPSGLCSAKSLSSVDCAF